MKTTARPIRSTMVFGVVCGLLLVPLAVGFSYVLSWSIALCIIFWGYLSAYSYMLTRWSKKSFISSVFPLLLVLVAIFWIDSISAFLLIALGVFSWIRSGICYPRHLIRRLFGEIALCLGGGALVAFLTPISVFSWAMAVWLFFLVQTLYFVIFENDHIAQENMGRDPFDRAREQAEEILTANEYL